MLTPEQQTLITAWQDAQVKAEAAKQAVTLEQNLRKQVMASLFADGKEGTNTVELANGWKLKGTIKLDRKLDKATLLSISDKLRELGVNPDTLVEWKPDLKTSVYRELTAEQATLFDTALTIKPGSPTLELVAPKEPK